MAKGTYGYIALNDLYVLYDTKLRPCGMHATAIHDVAEKLLKHVIAIECADSDDRDIALHSHSFMKLVNKISEVHPIKKNTLVNIRTLSDSYYEVRYPGDNYIDVDKELMNDYIECLNSILSWFMFTADIESLHSLNCEVNNCSRLCDDYLEDNLDNRKLLTKLLNIHPIDLLP